MLSIDDLKTLREAYRANDQARLIDAMGRIGNPSEEAIVASALEQMRHPDRNRRVLALRILARQRGERAKHGVLAGLQDEVRRVCTVAIQACPNFLAYEAIVAQLEAMTRDAGRKRKLRRRALSMLAGDEGRLPGDLTPAVSGALWRLMTEPDYRFGIVFGLVRLELAPRGKLLLEAFARSADDVERGLAERRLAGERVIHIGAYERDEARQRWIMASCDVAHGRMYYWLPPEPSPAAHSAK